VLEAWGRKPLTIADRQMEGLPTGIAVASGTGAVTAVLFARLVRGVTAETRISTDRRRRKREAAAQFVSTMLFKKGQRNMSTSHTARSITYNPKGLYAGNHDRRIGTHHAELRLRHYGMGRS